MVWVQHWLGVQGMPRRYYDYVDQYQPMHMYSTVGSWVLLVGFLVVAVNLAQSLVAGKKAPANPWGGTTLEWQIASPPPMHNFLEEVVVTRGPYERPEGEEDGDVAASA